MESSRNESSWGRDQVWFTNYGFPIQALHVPLSVPQFRASMGNEGLNYCVTLKYEDTQTVSLMANPKPWETESTSWFRATALKLVKNVVVGQSNVIGRRLHDEFQWPTRGSSQQNRFPSAGCKTNGKRLQRWCDAKTQLELFCFSVILWRFVLAFSSALCFFVARASITQKYSETSQKGGRANIVMGKICQKSRSPPKIFKDK